MSECLRSFQQFPSFQCPPHRPGCAGPPPLKGRLRVLRQYVGNSPVYSIKVNAHGAQIHDTTGPNAGSTATPPEQVPDSILFQMLFYFLTGALSSTIVQNKAQVCRKLCYSIQRDSRNWISAPGGSRRAGRMVFCIFRFRGGSSATEKSPVKRRRFLHVKKSPVGAGQ